MEKRLIYNHYLYRDTREICHAIKNRNEECYKIMADYFLEQEIIDTQCLLIPAPQHEGYAIYTKSIAEIIASKSGAKVLDVIKSNPRKSLYECKQNQINAVLDFKITEKVFFGTKKVFLVDNVLHTGQTLSTCQKILGHHLIPLVYGISSQKYNRYIKL